MVGSSPAFTGSTIFWLQLEEIELFRLIKLLVGKYEPDLYICKEDSNSSEGPYVIDLTGNEANIAGMV